MSTTMTVRLEGRASDRLDHLAAATQRSKSCLAAQAIRASVENNEWQIGEIRAALREADADDFASDKDVASGHEVEIECGLGGCARRCAPSTKGPSTLQPTT